MLIQPRTARSLFVGSQSSPSTYRTPLVGRDYRNQAQAAASQGAAAEKAALQAAAAQAAACQAAAAERAAVLTAAAQAAAWSAAAASAAVTRAAAAQVADRRPGRGGSDGGWGIGSASGDSRDGTLTETPPGGTRRRPRGVNGSPAREFTKMPGRGRAPGRKESDPCFGRARRQRR